MDIYELERRVAAYDADTAKGASGRNTLPWSVNYSGAVSNFSG